MEELKIFIEFRLTIPFWSRKIYPKHILCFTNKTARLGTYVYIVDEDLRKYFKDFVLKI
jgi:hypothetical protein